MEITGRIVRVLMFHSLLITIGTTGWMLRMFCRALFRTEIQIGVVLERHADEVAHGVSMCSLLAVPGPDPTVADRPASAIEPG